MKLEIKDLRVKYSNSYIIDGVSTDFTGGKLFTIIGPNGTGKSTFAKSIAGLINKKGDISLSIDDKQISTKEIVYLPQMHHMDSSLSVFEIVLLGMIKDLSLKIQKKNIDIVIALLKELNIEELVDKNFNSLSGGQKQLVLLAQALICNPKVLILDEPTSALDLKHQLHVLNIAKSYTVKHKIICITILHDLSLAARFSDEILILNAGKIVKKGKAKDVLNEEIISEVYGVKVDVALSNQGYTTVTPIETL